MKIVKLEFDIGQEVYAATNEGNGVYTIAIEKVNRYSMDEEGVVIRCDSDSDVHQDDCFDNPDDAASHLLKLIKEDDYSIAI